MASAPHRGGPQLPRCGPSCDATKAGPAAPARQAWRAAAERCTERIRAPSHVRYPLRLVIFFLASSSFNLFPLCNPTPLCTPPSLRTAQGAREAPCHKPRLQTLRRSNHRNNGSQRGYPDCQRASQLDFSTPRIGKKLCIRII